MLNKTWLAVICAVMALGACGGGGGAGTSAASSGGGGEAALKTTVSIEIVGSGTVASVASGSCTANCNATVDTNALVTLSAVAQAGYQFIGWQGGCAATTAVCTLTADVAKSVTAVFVATAQSACATSFYASDFALSAAVTTDLVPTLAKPLKGVSFADPTYRTCVTRATDHTADGVAGFTRNDYARRQAFNADSTKFIVYALNGSWHVYDATTRVRIKTLAGPAGDAEPQWHSTNPDVLYYLPTNGVGMKVQELTVSTGVTRTLGDLSARLKALWPAANSAWTKSEGSPSKDGRYWCFMVDSAAWGTLGVVTWDRDTNTILGSMSTNGERPDHVSMSPSGNHCVVSGDGPRGTVAYARDFSSQRLLLAKSEHSDIAIDANGDDVYVAVDYQSNAGDLSMLNLRTGAKTVLFPTYVAGSATAYHISGKAFSKPGWVLMSTYGDYGGKQWLHKKVFAVQLAANPKVLNLASTHAVENEYWTEPHATVNRDFTKVLFNSNWGVNSSTDVDAYMVEIPANAVR